MSCVLDVTNESARCWEKISSSNTLPDLHNLASPNLTTTSSYLLWKVKYKEYCGQDWDQAVIWILAKFSYFDCGGSRKVEIHKNKQDKRGQYPTTLFFFYKNVKYKKIYPCKGKQFEKKKQCTPSSPNKRSCSSPKKIDAREMSTKKYSCSSKIPQPLHSFSNGPSLMREHY